MASWRAWARSWPSAPGAHRGRGALLGVALLVVLAFVPRAHGADAAASGDASRRPSFDPALVRKGEALAAVGDCRSCHTAPGGKAYAGGVALRTPFGTIYGTNITPDPDTGIGRWSQAQFARAMREGVDANGRQLYPVFPYDHFRVASDDDLAALYAYLMTRDAVVARDLPNEVRFPFNARPLVATWKALYLERIALPRDPQRGERWNRGAYLVAGLGHCGACHTPRNALGAEDPARTFDGADVEGWHAPALGAASPTPVPWDADAMTTYLRTGVARGHSIAAGPMAEVIRGLRGASDDDVRAMAEYVVSLGAPASGTYAATGREAAPATAAVGGSAADADAPEGRGARIYAMTCAVCHDAGRRAWPEGALGMRNWIAATIPSPANLIEIVLHGITPPPGEHGLWMPAFAGSLTDTQLADLAAYVRARAGQAPWPDVAASIRRARGATP